VGLKGWYKKWPLVNGKLKRVALQKKSAVFDITKTIIQTKYRGCAYVLRKTFIRGIHGL
jgi:hypothetical protein